MVDRALYNFKSYINLWIFQIYNTQNETRNLFPNQPNIFVKVGCQNFHLKKNYVSFYLGSSEEGDNVDWPGGVFVLGT